MFVRYFSRFQQLEELDYLIKQLLSGDNVLRKMKLQLSF